MKKEQVIEILEHGASSEAAKIECLQFYIDNYPVSIELWDKKTVFQNKKSAQLD